MFLAARDLDAFLEGVRLVFLRAGRSFGGGVPLTFAILCDM